MSLFRQNRYRPVIFYRYDTVNLIRKEYDNGKDDAVWQNAAQKTSPIQTFQLDGRL